MIRPASQAPVGPGEHKRHNSRHRDSSTVLHEEKSEIVSKGWTVNSSAFRAFGKAYVPDDFALSLCFAGGGVYSAGRLMFDVQGNLWSGQNWMPGSQSGVNQSIGGGVVKLAPNGTALSPPITGFTGMGIDGVGWGTAVTLDKVWITSFNGKMLVMDFDGRPIGSENDFPFKEKTPWPDGHRVAANGDVWIADGSDNQLLHFPGGRVKDGWIVKVAGLKSPFDIVIDAQNRVWVSNSQSDTVVRFPVDDPASLDDGGPRSLCFPILAGERFEPKEKQTCPGQ
jgi:streptogramin lyase